jgi:hypothetical protein
MADTNESRTTQDAKASSDLNQQMETNQSGADDSLAKDAVKKLVSAYLRTPIRVSFHFPCW